MSGGLAGWIDPTSDLRGERATLAAMTATLAHRGPDGRRLWLSRHAALGLCLRGAPDDPGPAVVETPGGTVAAVLAGRLGRPNRLRAAVHTDARRPPPGTDSELLLAGYLRRGAAVVEQMEGVFAFVIWDGRDGTVLLGRDRMGICPLYVHHLPGGGLVFGSEPKAVLAHGALRPRVRPAAVPLLLQPRLTLPGETPLTGLDEVPPAHVLRRSAGATVPTRYWSLRGDRHPDGFEDSVRTVRALLAEAVADRTPASQPCGAMLSGGIDSTSVAALATASRAPAAGPPDTFCVEFPGDRDSFSPTELRPEVDAPYAAAAAEHLGARHHVVPIEVDDLDGAVPATRAARDLPGWGQFDASMYLLFREMRRHGTVALTGEAADEVFGGYPYLLDPDAVSGDGFPWLGRGPRLADHLAPAVTSVVDPAQDELDRYKRLVADVPRLDGEDPADARVREALYLGMCGPLAVILDRMERMSAAAGVEVRFPFCDHRLVEYVWNVPWPDKSRGGVKGLLKAATADVVPASTLNRRKSAYPHVQNPAYERALLRRARAIVGDDGSAAGGLFDRPRTLELIDRLEAAAHDSSLPGGVSAPQLLVQLVELDAWIDGYGVSVE